MNRTDGEENPDCYSIWPVVLIASTGTEKLWKNEPLFDNQSMTGKKIGVDYNAFCIETNGVAD